ncbi:response regulator [bacterium]|nr:response regulator [bacterium]
MTESKPSEHEAGNRTGYILIADDTEFFRLVLGDVLKAEGYQILYAKDGRETLEQIIAHKHEICMLIMDVVMPEMTGREVLENLRDQNIKLQFPILIMTGFKQDPDEIFIFRQLGIDGFISKSEPPRFFVARIKQTLHPCN